MEEKVLRTKYQANRASATMKSTSFSNVRSFIKVYRRRTIINTPAAIMKPKNVGGCIAAPKPPVINANDERRCRSAMVAIMNATANAV